MKQRIFITGIGTGIGKTFITAALIRQAKEMGRSAAAFKPVISGFNLAHAAESDAGTLLESMGLPVNAENIARIAPLRFKAPLAPSMAARAENRPALFHELVSFGRKAMTGAENFALIEGAGGVMAPLDDHHTVLDWIEELRIEAMLVAGTYLGALSHTLTALEALSARKIPVHSVIINESAGAAVPLKDTVDELARWTRLPLIPVARRANGDWKDIRELRPLIA